MTVTLLPSVVVQAKRWRVLLAVAAGVALAAGGGLLLAAAVVKTPALAALASVLMLPGAALVLAGAALLPAALLAAARVRVAEAPSEESAGPVIAAVSPVVPPAVAPVAVSDAAPFHVVVPPAALVVVACAVGVWWFWPVNGLPIIVGLIIAVMIVLGARRSASSPTEAQGSATVVAPLRMAPHEREAARLRRLAGWPQTAVMLPLVLVVGALVWWLWPVAGTVPGSLGLGIVLLILAFPVLVIERRLTLTAASELPEAGALARLLRLVMWVLLISGVCALAQALGAATLAWWGRLALAGLLLGVAVELLLRALSAPFLPVTGLASARGVADSVLAGVLLPRLGASASMGGGLQERFGIDLSHSWALRFVRRAAPALMIILFIVAWLLSGITVLSVAERGVYERLGAPVAVLRSGLHVHLPWPFGIVRRLEFGAVHQLSLADGGDPEDDKRWRELATLPADAPTTNAFDRMWGAPHVGDAIYAVPSTTIQDGAPQGCQLLNGDARVFYRIGLDDAAAQASLYRVATPEETLRLAARRLLTRSFAVRPVLAAIGEDRELLARELRTALQQQLDADGSGLEITAVSVDSVHPPAKAAATYYSVQEAGIAIDEKIATARGNAFRSGGAVAADVITTKADGEAAAYELIAKARVDRTLFNAYVIANRQTPAALRLERWLWTLSRSLERSRVTLIDHRLDLGDGPVIDLRRFAGPQDPQ